MDRISEATKMVEAFIGAGAHVFDTLRTTIEKRSIPGGYHPVQSPSQLRERLPHLMAASLREITNLIIRPHIRPPSGLLQLDDLNAEMVEAVRPLAFLVLAASATGRQAWVATEGCDASFFRRVKQAAGADMGATGWVRLAGSLNIKRDYVPSFPTVQIEMVQQRAKVKRATSTGWSWWLQWNQHGTTPARHNRRTERSRRLSPATISVWLVHPQQQPEGRIEVWLFSRGAALPFGGAGVRRKPLLN